MKAYQPSSNSNDQRQVIGRRRLLQSLLGFSIIATLGGVLTPIIGYLWPPSRASGAGSGRVQVGTLDDFPAGQGKVVPVNDKPVIIVNTAQGELRAFSAICTHLSCIVSGTRTGSSFFVHATMAVSILSMARLSPVRRRLPYPNLS